MPSKKTKEISEKVEKSLKEIEENSKLLDEANEEDSLILENKRIEIENSLKKDNLFCGVILTTDTIFEIIKLHLNTNEPIKIPFNLYFN